MSNVNEFARLDGGEVGIGRLGHNDETDQMVVKEVAGKLGTGNAVMLAAGDLHIGGDTSRGAVGLRPGRLRPAGCERRGRQADTSRGGGGGGWPGA